MTKPKARKDAEISTPQYTQTKMIPLHIADQAVAACEAEIQKLREEVTRLRFEIKGLEEDCNRLEHARDFEGRRANNFQAQAEEARQANKELKAEVARLRAASFVTAVPSEQYDRVVKAGDASIISGNKMREIIGDHHWTVGEFDQVRERWNAAKEGKTS